MVPIKSTTIVYVNALLKAEMNYTKLATLCNIADSVTTEILHVTLFSQYPSLTLHKNCVTKQKLLRLYQK